MQDQSADFEIAGINWKTSIFLAATFVIAIVGTPIYLVTLGLGQPDLWLFVALYAATGFSITVGYHRLFTHRTYTATWPARLGLLLFGAAAFQWSALNCRLELSECSKTLEVITCLSLASGG